MEAEPLSLPDVEGLVVSLLALLLLRVGYWLDWFRLRRYRDAAE